MLRLLWEDCPAITRVFCLGYPILSVSIPIVARFLPTVRLMFICCLYTIFEERCLWAPLLSMMFRPLQSPASLVMILTEIFLSLAYLPDRERELGSCRFFGWALIMHGIVNIVYLCMALCLSKVLSHHYWFSANQGLWPLLMVCITVQSLSSPHEPVSVFGLLYVQNHWYPVLLAFLLCMLSGGFLWDVIAALLVGYLYTALRLERFLIPVSTAVTLERNCLCSCIRRVVCHEGNWVPASGARGYEDIEIVSRRNPRYATLSDLRATAQRIGAGANDARPVRQSCDVSELSYSARCHQSEPNGRAMFSASEASGLA